MEQALKPERWITVRVEDTGDGMIINAEDAARWSLDGDRDYHGYPLPDGNYRINIAPTAIEASPVVGEIEAVDAALAAWKNDFLNGAPEQDERSAMRAALEAARASLQSEYQALREEMIVAPAECDSGCDDPHCHYSHQPLTLRQAYENSVERMRNAEHRAEAAESKVQSLTLKLEEREKPDSYWLADDPECGYDNYEEPVSEASMGDVVHLLAGKMLGDVWATTRVLSVDESGDWDDSETVCFDNEEEAKRCWFESLEAARALQSGGAEHA